MTPSPATLAIHADDRINTLTDVAPPLHPSTTFRYPSSPSLLESTAARSDSSYDLTTPLVYSRVASAGINRLETVLAPLIYPNTPDSEIEELSNHVVTYSTGISAFHALLTHLVPKVIAIGDGYHGCHGVISLHTRLHGVKTVDLHGSDADWDTAGLGKGDLIHVETPLNPTGEAYNIQSFAERAHKRGALLSVDATFGPPGLQDPFAWGADVVLHSGTKYIGGHSDMLCGILATARGEDGARRASALRGDRIFLGSVLGSLEGWLGVRSLRTLELRVQRQSQNAEKLVKWMYESLQGRTEDSDIVKAVVKNIKHASLQTAEFDWLKKQMPNGFGTVFSIRMKDVEKARCLPSHLKYFHHATSLGGVESLIEWRRMTDAHVEETLLRVSVGVEDWRDLKEDLLGAFKALQLGEKAGGRNGRVVDVVSGGPGAVGAADGA